MERDEPLPLGVTGRRIGQHLNREFNDVETMLCLLGGEAKPSSSGCRSCGDVPKFRNVLHPATKRVSLSLERVQRSQQRLDVAGPWDGPGAAAHRCRADTASVVVVVEVSPEISLRGLGEVAVFLPIGR